MRKEIGEFIDTYADTTKLSASDKKVLEGLRLSVMDVRLMLPTTIESLAYVFLLCCEEFGVSKSEALSGLRVENVRTARECYSYLVKRYTKFTLAKIGDFIGQNHATVLDQVSRVSERVKTRGFVHGEVVPRLEAIIEKKINKPKLGTVKGKKIKVAVAIMDGYELDQIEVSEDRTSFVYSLIESIDVQTNEALISELFASIREMIFKNE